MVKSMLGYRLLVLVFQWTGVTAVSILPSLILMRLSFVLVKPPGWIKVYIRWIIILTKEAGGLTTSKRMKKGNKDC